MSGAAGDLLLAPRSAAPRWRTDAGTRLEVDADDALRVQETAADWCGWPVEKVRATSHDAWVVGELYPPSTAADVALVLDGGADPSALNGHFALLARDRRSGTWEAWSDRFGTVHLFVGAVNGRPVASTCSRAAASVTGGEADGDAVLVFCLIGFYPGRRTPVRGLSVVPPSTRACWDEATGAWRLTTTWRWPSGIVRPTTADAALERLAVVFDDVATWHLRGDVAVPVSGGLDSRSTLLPLARGTRSPVGINAFSYGYWPGSPEIEIAQDLGGRLDVAVTTRVIEPFLLDRLATAVRALEGYQDLTQARQLAVADWLAATAPAVVAAHWGDVWLDGAGVPRDGDVAVAARRKLAKPGAAELLEVLRPLGSADEAERLLLEWLEDAVDAVDHVEDARARLRAFKTLTWSHRWTLASLRAYQVAAFPRLPFYDTRLTDVLVTLPDELVQGRRLQVELLRRFAPALARARWQETGTDLDHVGAPTVRDRIWNLRRAARYRLRPYPIRSWEVQLAGGRERSRLRELLLDAGGTFAAAVDRKALERLLDDFDRRPRRETGFAASMLLTLATGLEWHRHA